jgi:hypothetical protein
MSTPKQAFDYLASAAARVLPIAEFDNFKAACQTLLAIIDPPRQAPPAPEPKPATP